MKLRVVGSEKTFDVPREMTDVMLAVSDGKLEIAPKATPSRPRFNPQTAWTVFTNPHDTFQVGLKGHCTSCNRAVTASGSLDHIKTVFLTHCGVAKDRPPKHIIDQYASLLPKTSVEMAVEKVVEKVKKVFAL